MKLKHLFEYQFPEIQQKTVKRLPKQHKLAFNDVSVLRNKKVKHLGSGAFASAYANEDRPEDVRKVSGQSSVHDGYMRFVKALKDSQEFGNPYFPKFREASEYKNQEDHMMMKRSVYSVKTERLQQLEQLTKSEVAAVMERWFGENWTDVAAQLHIRNRPVNGANYPSAVLVEVLKRLVKSVQLGIRLRDNELERAVAFIQKFSANDAADPDISMNNIMYKRSPYGIQLVFTDPVA